MCAGMGTKTGEREAFGVWAAIGSLVATLVTGAACVVPLLAIVVGIGGLGWLARYAYLRVPASIATFALLAAGFAWAYRKRARGACSPAAKRNLRIARGLLWSAALLAIAMNVLEYLVFPELG